MIGDKTKMRIFHQLGVAACLGMLAGCANPSTPLTDSEPTSLQLTATQSVLLNLPLPSNPVPVAVYGFEDKTGQFKPQENTQSLSRAVSQGGDAILVKALRDAGNGGWFRVLERTGLDNLLKERKIIREMRSRYLGETEINPKALPPLLFAGVILEGGIVGFDTNTLTGGAGARFLGIGADVKYRQNTVTVNLRAVSVKTGEVLANVTTAKTIASIGLQGGVFKYVSFDELLELEAGITNNEPDTLALRRTIEKSVHSLIVEGSEAELWSFADAERGAEVVAAYHGNATAGVSKVKPDPEAPVTAASLPDAQEAEAVAGAADVETAVPEKTVVASSKVSLTPTKRLGVPKASEHPSPKAAAPVERVQSLSTPSVGTTATVSSPTTLGVADSSKVSVGGTERKKVKN